MNINDDYNSIHYPKIKWTFLSNQSSKMDALLRHNAVPMKKKSAQGLRVIGESLTLRFLLNLDD